jgi:hypothetical protein
MGIAATLPLLLDRRADEAGGRRSDETTSAVLDMAACFAEAGRREAALLIERRRHLDAAFDAV